MNPAHRLGGLWKNRRFVTFWSAQTVSEFGDRISELALPLIAVTLLDANAAEVGFLTAAVWLPNLLSLLIGSWVEQRSDKRRLMVAADLARAIILLSLPIAFWLGHLTLVQLYLIAILAGAAHVVFNTAYAAFFVRLVRREEFLEANSKLSVTRSLSFMGGPALGGVLIQWLSAPVAIFADVVSFLFSAVQVMRVEVEPVPPDETQESVLARARAGMRYLLRHPYMRSSLFCATTINLFNFIGSALLVLFATRSLGLPAGAIGIAIGVGASGSLLGAVAAGPLSRRFGVGPVIAFGAFGFPAAMAIIAIAGGPAWLAAGELALAEFIGGFAVMCFDVPLGALQASVIEDSWRSRISGAFISINYGVRPLGAVLGGVLGSSIGLRETLLLSASGGIFALLWLVRSPILKVRSIDDLRPISADELG